MTKSLVIIFVLTLLVSCTTTIATFQTTDKEKIGVKSNRFRGTIFTTSYQANKLFIATADSINRFTPTQKDIAFAENILREQIEKANKPHTNQFGKRQYIEKNLSKYFRQYVGLINKQGERIIHVNLHWERFTLKDRIKGYWDDRLDYTSDFSTVFDGGSRYWSINVNLTTKTLYGLSVNGVA
jgi:hypothetical protein